MWNIVRQKGKGCLKRGGSTRPSSPRPLDILSRSSSRHRCLTCLSRKWSSSSLDDCPQVITHTKTQHLAKKKKKRVWFISWAEQLVEKNKKALITWHNKQCSCSTLASHLSWSSLSGRFVSHTTWLLGNKLKAHCSSISFTAEMCKIMMPLFLCVCVYFELIDISVLCPTGIFQKKILEYQEKKKREKTKKH